MTCDKVPVALMHVCACVLGGEGSWVFASTAVVVVSTAIHLTGYSDYPLEFREPLTDVTPV